MTTQLQFCWQSIHGLSHLESDTICLGPGAYTFQWTLEWTISNLGQEIKQPSNLYANLSICGLCRSQILALHALFLTWIPMPLEYPEVELTLAMAMLYSGLLSPGYKQKWYTLISQQSLDEKGFQRTGSPGTCGGLNYTFQICKLLAVCGRRHHMHPLPRAFIFPNMWRYHCLYHLNCGQLSDMFPVYIPGKLLYWRSTVLFSKWQLQWSAHLCVGICMVWAWPDYVVRVLQHSLLVCIHGSEGTACYRREDYHLHCSYGPHDTTWWGWKLVVFLLEKPGLSITYLRDVPMVAQNEE